MNNISKAFPFLVLLITLLVSCKKQDVGPLSDLRPSIPVTVQNAVDFRPDPTVSTSKAGGGNIQIVLSIPTASGRTIKEIAIAASTTYTAIQSTGTTGFYTSAPVSVNNATTYTFNTTVAEYVVKGPGAVPSFTNTELAKRFYFKLTLDDGTVIISEPVRVLYLD